MTRISTDDIALVFVLFNPKSEDIRHVEQIAALYQGAIVDNSESPHFQTSSVCKMRYIWQTKNTGIAAALNAGICHIQDNSKARYTIFFDQDSRFDELLPLQLAKVYDNIKKEVPQLAILGPTIINKESGETYKSAIHKDVPLNEDFVPKRDVISSGSCIATETISKIGQLDETLFIDFVDCEWCWRAQSMGFSCGITPKITLAHKVGSREIHFGKHIVSISAPFRYYYQYRNYILLLRRRYVPRQFKVNWGIKFLLRYLYFPFFVSRGVECWKFMNRGIADGLRSVLRQD